MKSRYSLPILFVIFCSTIMFSQFSPYHQWTLLSSNEMNEIIGETSGRAFNHMLEMSAYNRDRLEEEYRTTLMEGKYVLDKLKEYGIESAKIDRFPSSRQTWDGIKGQLWEISPKRSKLADYGDIRAMLASGSANTDTTAELVWVEEGEQEDFDGLDVKGKIVVTSGSMSRTHRNAVPLGAVGVISFNSPRPLDDQLQIPWRGLRGWGSRDLIATFGFYLPPREGHILRNRLKRGEKIKVHAVVESKMQDLDLQITTCVLPGTDPDSDEIIISAHIYEGYTKQGANDNISGSAAILEMARMLNTLYNEGRLEKPKRIIRFIWVPEYSGTGPWVNANKELMKKTLCNINLDMVGLWLSKSQSFFTMRRTTYGNPHYLNDVLENYFRYVGESNRENLGNRGIAGKYLNAIVSPSGSDDPFYYKIETHYGASDHEVFNDWGVQVPGIMLITWPDFYYHSSEDRPDKCDPTQLKRAIVIAAAATQTIANADHNMTVKIAAEISANSSKRIGIQLARAIDELNSATAENLTSIYKKVRGYIGAARINEKETLGTLFELTEDKPTKEYISAAIETVEEITLPNLSALKRHMEFVAKNLGVEPATLDFTPDETEAYSIIPKETAKVKEVGYRGYRSILNELPKEIKEKFPTEGLSRYHSGELVKLINGKNSLLHIKKMLESQYPFDESDLRGMINYVKQLEAAGLVEL